MEITLTFLCVLHANFVFFLPTALLSVYVVPKHYQNKFYLFLFQVFIRLPLSKRNLPVCKRIGKTANSLPTILIVWTSPLYPVAKDVEDTVQYTRRISSCLQHVKLPEIPASYIKKSYIFLLH